MKKKLLTALLICAALLLAVFSWRVVRYWRLTRFVSAEALSGENAPPDSVFFAARKFIKQKYGIEPQILSAEGDFRKNALFPVEYTFSA